LISFGGIAVFGKLAIRLIWPSVVFLFAIHNSIAAEIVRQGAGISWPHRHTEVMAKDLRQDGRFAMTVRVDPTKLAIVRAKFGA
jgi:hypothetical protein